jgi:NhaP-type Na+/H+ and K+/H+ antiporter
VNSLGDSIPVSLEIVLLVLGALLMAGALISGLVRRSFLSLAAVFVLAGFALQDVTLGLVYGVVLAWVASKLMPRGRRLTDSILAHAQSLYALGVAFAIYGVAVGVAPAGNGFIAVFVGAITLGILRPDLRVSFERRAEDIVEIVKLGIFVVFGSLAWPR